MSTVNVHHKAYLPFSLNNLSTAVQPGSLVQRNKNKVKKQSKLN